MASVAPRDETLKKESMYIKPSLTYLEQCVVALAKKGSGAHVPYRQTKLTNVLKDALGGNCNTLLFVRGLTEVECRSEQDALTLLFSGELGRTTAQHKLNRQSNRS